MHTALIVDDERLCCAALKTLLEQSCPGIRLVHCCHSGADALEAIRQLQPELVFLDVEMPGMSGFELLEQLSEINFALFFTTSYDRYALKAFRYSALDYLLKPVDRHELQMAVQKAEKQLARPLTQQLELLLQKFHHPQQPLKQIALPTMEGLQMVPVEQIIHCTSDRNYTVVYLKSKQKLIVSRTLKEVEEMLQEHSFVRVHHSNLVNLNEISKYVKGEGGYLVMKDGAQIDVSRSRKESLLRTLLQGR